MMSDATTVLDAGDTPNPRFTMWHVSARKKTRCGWPRTCDHEEIQT